MRDAHELKGHGERAGADLRPCIPKAVGPTAESRIRALPMHRGQGG